MGFRDWEMAQEQRRAEEAARRELEERLCALSVHPLVNAKADRNLREAYFNGLVFAALCDDFGVDETEKHLLMSIGSALGLDETFVSEMIANTQPVAENDDAKYQAKALFDESLNELRRLPSVNLRQLFVAEFAKVRLQHPECEGELQEGLSKIGATIEAPVEDVLTPIVAIVKASATAKLEDVDKSSIVLGDEVVKYFVVHEMGRIDDALDKFREQKENRRTLPERLAAIVESDDTWPVEFKPEDYKPLFAAADIPDSDVAAFVAREMLPYMKRACEAARINIRKVPTVTNYERWLPDDEIYTGAKFEEVKEFRTLFRYSFFIDSYVDLNGLHKKYYFIGPQEYNSDYFHVSNFISDRHKHITGKRIGEDRYKRLPLDCYPRELFDRLSCHLSIWDDDSDRYFVQWQELFSAITRRFEVK